MSAAFDSFDITVAQVPAGDSLTIGWDNFTLDGAPVTPVPADILAIQTTVFTSYLDDENFTGAAFEGTSLEASGGTLISSYTQTGLDNALRKTYTIEVVMTLTDTSNTVITQQAYGRVTKSLSLLSRAQLVVSSVGDNTATISFGPYPGTTTNWIDVVAFQSFNPLNYLNDDGTYDVDGVTLRWIANPGLDNVAAGYPVITGLVELTGDGSILDDNAFTIVDASFANGVIYEIGASLSNTGVYTGSAGVVRSTTVSATPTNKPEPPTDIVTVSTFEYNRDASGQNPLTVPTASTVTILFNTPVGQDPSTNYYTIYRTDLSSNGYTPDASSVAIGQVLVGSTGTYSYGGTDYSYNFIDASAAVVPGSFYGYEITGYNSNGTGIKSTPIRCVRDGEKAAKPTISGQGITQAIIVSLDASSTNLGGFDYATNYYIGWDASNGAITGNAVSTLPYTINGLTNGLTYNVRAYGTTTNSNYTVDYDISAGLFGTTISYYSAVSDTIQVTPYSSPPPVGQVVAKPNFDLCGNPLGHIVTTWLSDISFQGVGLNFQIRAYDASTNSLVSTAYTYSDLSGGIIIPAPQTVTFGTLPITTYYTNVRAFYSVNGSPVYSFATRSINTTYIAYYTPAITVNGNVIPFTAPGVPSLTSSLYAQDDGTNQAYIAVTMNNGTSGGLSPIGLAFTVTDASAGTVQATNSNATAGTTYDYPISSDISLNITYYAYTRGPDASGATQIQYNSLSTTVSGGHSFAHPVFSVGSPYIDASGILHIDASNNGAALNFIEGLVIDVSNTLQISYAVNVVGTTGSVYVNGSPVVSPAYFTIDQNNTTNSRVRINFNDPQVAGSTQILAIVSNTGGADVYNTFS
jgi:hypothetical protein